MDLVLSDGARFEGIPLGKDREVAGEVVFNTGMTGYVEALTDPSYRGQILVFTYPLQGNYGVPEGPFESDRVQVEGLVIGGLASRPSHPKLLETLAQWLERSNVPLLSGVDTRALTRRLRAAGTMNGALVKSGSQGRELPRALDMRRVAEIVTEPGVRRYDGGDKKILLVDTGAKESIVTSLRERGLSIVRAAYFEKWESLLDEVDGVMLPNGPGDPTDLGPLVERLRPLLSGKKPVLGICLGHQLLALAAGASTEKLAYGHRSQNQPVIDLVTKRTYMTSQNHGYAVKAASIPSASGFRPWFTNLNDQTNEGLLHESLPILSVQFHPEAASGPHDTQHVFDRFAEMVRR